MIVEKIIWLFVILIIIGSLIIMFGKTENSFSTVSTGRTMASVGVSGIAIILIVYLQILNFEYKERELIRFEEMMTS
jgi:hypothetical protein